MAKFPLDDDDYDPTPSPRTKARVTIAVILIMVLVAAGLVRALRPGFAAKVVDSVLSTFTATTPPPPLPPPPPPPPSKAEKESGKQGDAGKKAIPKETAAPKPKVLITPKPVPPNAGKGSANTSGAANQGSGTGAQGSSGGPGAGGSGNGTGGGAVTKPSVRSGEIDDSRDFGIPPGGRETRFGKSVIVTFTVTTDGRARDCTVKSSSVDADATARVCGLVIRKIRFNPAKRADGTPVEARYGYKVTFSPE